VLLARLLFAHSIVMPPKREAEEVDSLERCNTTPNASLRSRLQLGGFALDRRVCQVRLSLSTYLGGRLNELLKLGLG
jgi:hypothetical protein